ncbi:MAG: hypothetical protein AAF649_07510 [Verrucomicrobiota bacterium]
MSCVTGIKTGSDALASYKVVHAFEQGADFNHIWFPSRDGLDEFIQQPLTWWTPGQYALPWLITSWTDLPIHISEWLIVGLATISFALGTYLLIRGLGFNAIIARLSLALILSSQALLFRFHIYDGGTTLLDAVWPWVALLVLNGRYDFPAVILFVVLSLLAFFMKSSFLVIFISLGLFFFSKTAGWPMPATQIQVAVLHLKTSIRPLLGYLLCSLVILSILFGGYILQGDSPNSVSRQTDNTIPGDYSFTNATLYPIAAPVDAILQPASYLINKYSHSFRSARQLWLGSLALVSLSILLITFRSTSFPIRYRQFLLSFWGTYLFIFWYFYHSHVPISMDPRHFYPLAFILVPAAVFIIVNHLSKRLTHLTLVAFLLIAATNEYLFLKHRLLSNAKREWVDDYFYPEPIAESVRAIKSLDAAYHGNAVFYITPWNRFLEYAVKNNKVYPLGLGGTGIPRYRKTPYFDSSASHRGRAHALIVLTDHDSVVPADWFPDYTEFTLIRKTSSHLFWIGR